MPKVALVKGNESYRVVRDALEFVRDQVAIPDDRPVLIKPNLVSTTSKEAATPVDAVRATMDFLVEMGVERFIVGESSAGTGDTMGAFEQFGFFSLKDGFDVEFKNLNEDEEVVIEVVDADLNPVEIRLARSYLDSYLVSVAKMKTHNRVLATLSIKNVVIASIKNPDRQSPFSHQARAKNISMTRIAQQAVPNLAVIDGVVGMEGNGPVDGTAINSGIALAGTDALALDLVGIQAMGFDWRTCGYLWYLMQLRGLSWEDIEIVGEDLGECTTRYKPHQSFPEHLAWWVGDWRDYLGGSYLRG